MTTTALTTLQQSRDPLALGNALPVALHGVSTALADMTEDEFERALAKVSTTIARQKRIMREVLQPGVHFGNPKTKKGNAFNKEILYQAGADFIVDVFKLSWGVDEIADVEECSAAFVRVTVYRRLYDIGGRLIGRGVGSCTSHESKFTYGGGGYTWGKDARGALHVIQATASKRCRVATVAEAFGLRAWIGTDEEFLTQSESESESEGSQPVVPWTQEEKARLRTVALPLGLVRDDLEFLKQKLFGDRVVGTGDDAARFFACVQGMTADDVALLREDMRQANEEFPRALEEVPT